MVCFKLNCTSIEGEHPGLTAAYVKKVSESLNGRMFAMETIVSHRCICSVKSKKLSNIMHFAMVISHLKQRIQFWALYFEKNIYKICNII